MAWKPLGAHVEAGRGGGVVHALRGVGFDVGVLGGQGRVHHRHLHHAEALRAALRQRQRHHYRRIAHAGLLGGGRQQGRPQGSQVYFDGAVGAQGLGEAGRLGGYLRIIGPQYLLSHSPHWSRQAQQANQRRAAPGAPQLG